MPHKIFVGSYTNVISTLLFDPAADPPSLVVVGETPAGASPSWISFHPSDRSTIIASNEQDDGKVLVFKVKEEELELVQTVDSGGQNPAHLWVGEHEVVAANYSSGTLLTIPFEVNKERPQLGDPAKPIITCKFPGTGPHAERQEGSHPHQVYAHPNGQELLVPDLGSDKVWRLGRDAEGVAWEIKDVINVEAGHGPRHVVVQDGTLYVLNELSNTVSAYTLPPLGDGTEVTHITTLSSLKPQSVASPDMLAAEILLSRGPNPLLYLSNRNEDHPEGDAITIFSPSSAETPFHYVGEVRTGLKHLRAVTFGGENDRYLVLGGLNGGGIKVFERSEDGTQLKELAHLADGIVGKPTSFLFL